MLILLGIVVGIILVIIKIPIPKYSLHKIDRSRLGNELYPWEDVIKCKDYEFKSPRFNELIELHDIECPKCICENREKKMIVVEYSTPKESWLLLAGRRGPLFICKHHLDQIKFIVQTLS